MARFSLPKSVNLKAADWLPGVALFLCLGLFAMAGVLLIGANADPVTGQSAYVTGVSAQGYQGLKRLLAARGHAVAVNRDEDGPARARADLEIITLDGDNANLVFGVDQDLMDGASSSASASASSASASASSAGPAAPDRDYYYPAPDPKRADHILYHPLGKAVLVVAPKWSAARMEKHPLWDVDPTPIPAAIVRDNLEVLAPAEESVAPLMPGKPADLPPPPPGRARLQSLRRLIVFDIPHYEIRRDARPRTAAEKAAAQKAAQALPKGFAPGVDAANTDVPVRRLWRASGSVSGGAYDLGAISGFQSITAPNLQPVLTTQDGRPVLSRLIVTGGRRQPVVPVYVLSEPDLLNNTILADPQRAANALNLIEALSGRRASIVFNLTFAGMGFDHDLLHTLARPPYVAAPLCLLLMGVTLMWAAFSRFGPPLPAPEAAPLGRGVRLLADNAARLFALTMKQPKLAGAYAQHVRDMVLRRRGSDGPAPGGEPPDELAERIGRAHGATDSYLDLKARADKARTVHQLIDITRRLHAWKTEIDRAHI
ncbi:MAG TPA: hypothetical protein VF402_08920 [Asticcacaulis sp.]